MSIIGIKQHGRVELGFSDNEQVDALAPGPYLQTLANRLGGGLGAFDPTLAFGAGRADEINRSLVARIQDAINLRDFAVGDGEVNDTSKIQAALTRAVDQQRPLYVPYGTFRMTASVVAEGGVTIFGPGEFYVDADVEDAGISIDIPVLADVAISSIDNTVDYDASNGTGTTSPIAVITLSASAPMTLVPGRICKIVSSDQMDGAETGKFRGEFVRVLTVSGTQVRTTGRLRDTYTTSPRLVALDDSQRVELIDFRMRSNWASLVANNWFFFLARITGAVAPLVKGVRFEDGPNGGIWFRGCFGHRTVGVTARRMRNAVATQSIPGYGIQDGGCALGSHEGFHAQECRHAFTTVSHTAALQPRVAWGRNFGTIISGGVAYACSSAAWDTHSDADSVMFDGCQAHAGYYGENSAHAGFQLRGNFCTINGGRVTGHAYAVILYKQILGEAGRHVVRGLDYHGDGIFLRAIPQITGFFFFVEDCTADSTADRCLQLSDCEADVRNLRFRSRAPATTNLVRMIDMTNENGPAKIRMRGGEFDVRSSLATLHDVGRFEVAGCEAEVYSLDILAGSNEWRAVFSSQFGEEVDVDGAFDITADKYPIFSGGEDNPGGLSSLGAGSSVDGQIRLTPLRASDRFEERLALTAPVNGTVVVVDLNGSIRVIESLAYATSAGTCTISASIADADGSNPTLISALVSLAATTTPTEAVATGNRLMAVTGTADRRLIVTIADVTGMETAELRLAFRCIRA